MRKGLGLSAACGVSYGLYSPAFNIATNDHFHMAGPGASPCLRSLHLRACIGMCACNPRREPYRKPTHAPGQTQLGPAGPANCTCCLCFGGQSTFVKASTYEADSDLCEADNSSLAHLAS